MLLLSILTAAVVLASAVGQAGAQPKSFSIDRFAVTLEVNPDSSLTVREGITFQFRGSHEGIYRTIPVRYSRDGFDWALRLEAIGVFDESFHPLRTEVSHPGSYVRIKAWVPGAVDTAKTVTVTYRVRRGLFTVEDHQELYWNVTGNEWDVTVRLAEAVVVSPPAVPLEALRSIAYTGYRGTAGADYREERAANFLTVRTTRPLRPREGLTIAVAWPAGTFGRAGRWQELAWLLADNWPLGFPLLALALGFLAWWTYGRDPPTDLSIKPEYAPPESLAPAEAGTLLDERAHPRDVIATLVDLAIRGYIRIEQVSRVDDEPDFLFRRLKPVMGDPAVRPFELFVLAKLFDTDWTLNMRLLSEARRDYDNVFPPIRDEIYRTMVLNRLFPASPGRVRAMWLGLGMVILLAAGLLFLQPPNWLRAPHSTLALGLALTGLVIAAFSPLMPRKTWRGARVLAGVRGFQEFLERAEKDRLERLPPDTLHRWLPWAIALGVTERWIFNWDGLPVDKPSWLSGDDSFSLASYHRAVTTFGRRAEEAILTTRRGAGGGGWSGGSGFSGGSSGGGMGGGGGGTF